MLSSHAYLMDPAQIYQNYSGFYKILTFSLIVLAMNDNAIPEKNDINPLANLYANYLQSFYKLLNGESHTIHAI